MPQSPDRQVTQTRAALLGHDMRNAISDILSGLELSDLSSMDYAMAQQLRAVQSAARQLARLSDEVLALVSGEALPSDTGPAVIQLPEFLQELANRWPTSAANPVGLTLKMGADLPRLIGTPERALERALVNIIGNSMKHTPKGVVTLGVTLDSHEALRFTVRDTGRGFSDEALARLFELGGRPAASATPGTGMGLHIVRELVDRIRGRLDIANAPDGGAQVSIILPRTAWAPGVSLQSAENAPPDLTGKTVLVAEDNLTNQLLIRQMLETLGARCMVAADGEQALNLLRRLPIDLALVDIEMPRLSGLDVITSWRADETSKGADRLPILAVTAFVLSSNRAQIYDAGADAILAKPIMSLESFGQAIAALLAKFGTPPQVACEQTALEGTLHLDRLLALAGEAHGRELMSRLIQDFATVSMGIERALTNMDYAEMRAHTHVLISLAGAVGSSTLQGKAEQLNDAANSNDNGVISKIAPGAVDDLAEIRNWLAQQNETRFGEERA
ncbi:hypothetical protein ACMU_15720 [Actibacterium mucosum KCTC 23349]|uniref:histidine kinase n=2 Tax=Actibacterium TaxID=1433986 RepID=A0A037ZGD3_9RHOB|nr:hypothetical protein ACMU_15720 [Actibacterium mucosum KCTC 23349]